MTSGAEFKQQEIGLARIDLEPKTSHVLCKRFAQAAIDLKNPLQMIFICECRERSRNRGGGKRKGQADAAHHIGGFAAGIHPADACSGETVDFGKCSSDNDVVGLLCQQLPGFIIVGIDIFRIGTIKHQQYMTGQGLV